MRIRRTRFVLAATAFIAGLAIAAPAAEAAPSVSFQCTPAPADCLGWYRTNVTITWTIQPSDATRTGCVNATYTADTPPGGTDAFCRAEDTNGQATTAELKIRRDATPPVVVGGSPVRAADAGGWYNHDVLVTFKGTDQTSGIRSCTSTSYGGPDAAAASVTGTCVDNAGNTSSPLAYGLKYDATGPQITNVGPERPPDFAGWYNRPVRFDVAGTDALSGLAECPSVFYTGPDGSAARVDAACSDRAGNTSTRGFLVPFDASAPVAARFKAAAGDRRIDVSWRRPTDAVSVELTRSPGRGKAAETVLHSGPGKAFRDRKVVNGRRYTYRLRLADAAGNVSVRSVAAKAGPRLIAPRHGAERSRKHPPLLRWTPVRRASYYNVQLFRDGRKILSAWPGRTRFRLKREWSYAGRRHRLARGTYQWYVWPGYGARSDRRFGRLIGQHALRLR
ncbi:MAG TPA: hypothetical protein VFY87_03275 [Geminicoccaceae bacterium]|nr:hypothetical protein [Geminicoccaceae bacterium]